MEKYTNPANPVKQKLRPLPEFPGVLRNVLGVLQSSTVQKSEIWNLNENDKKTKPVQT